MSDATPTPSLSVRARKALRRLNATTPEELSEKTLGEVFYLRNCGPCTVRELHLWLALHGLNFAPDQDDPENEEMLAGRSNVPHARGMKMLSVIEAIRRPQTIAQRIAVAVLLGDAEALPVLVDAARDEGLLP